MTRPPLLVLITIGVLLECTSAHAPAKAAAEVGAKAKAAAKAEGAAIPVQAGDEPTVVTKVRVVDCRAVRGFIGAPVDGSTKSGMWDGRMWEYPMREGGVG